MCLNVASALGNAEMHCLVQIIITIISIILFYKVAVKKKYYKTHLESPCCFATKRDVEDCFAAAKAVSNM